MIRVTTNTLILAMCGAFLLGCNLWDQDQWHQKVIVEVDTPEGIVTGSSVQQVRFSKANFQVPAGGHSSFRVSGEAVVVDLGSDSKLFVLLRGDINHDAAGLFAPIAFSGDGGEPGAKAVKSQPVGASARLPERAYPMMVTFTDVSDPTSVKRVDPNNLTASFGGGMRLKEITIEITREPVTKGRVEDVLGDWINLPRQDLLQLGGGTNPVKLKNNSPQGYIFLGRAAFRTGD